MLAYRLQLRKHAELWGKLLEVVVAHVESRQVLEVDDLLAYGLQFVAETQRQEAVSQIVHVNTKTLWHGGGGSVLRQLKGAQGGELPHMGGELRQRVVAQLEDEQLRQAPELIRDHCIACAKSS